METFFVKRCVTRHWTPAEGVIIHDGRYLYVLSRRFENIVGWGKEVKCPDLCCWQIYHAECRYATPEETVAYLAEKARMQALMDQYQAKVAAYRASKEGQ